MKIEQYIPNVETLQLRSGREWEIECKKLFDEYYSVLIGVVKRLEMVNDYADEIADDTLLKVIWGIGLYDPKKSAFSSWVFTILWNVVRDYYRILRNRVVMYTEAVSEEVIDELELVYTTNNIDAITTVNSNDDYALLRRVYLDQVSRKEIADELGITRFALRKRLSRDMNKLRTELEITVK